MNSLVARAFAAVYECGVFQTLREKLRCKEIWVVGADRWRDPDDDLPKDFEDRRAENYAKLRKPLDPQAFVDQPEAWLRHPGRRLRTRPLRSSPSISRPRPSQEDTTVTDARAKRIQTLNAAAQAKSRAKTLAADQAIRTLIKRGEPITFQAVQREAGVSHAFLYGHPELRGRIERLRAQARPTAASPPPGDEQSTLVLALTSQLTHLKKQHRQEVQALRDALEQAHGENLDLRRELARRGAPSQDSVR